MKKHLKTNAQPTNLQRQLKELKELKPEELRRRWQTLFGSNSPLKILASLMIQAIARRMQEKVFGTLKPSTQRLLQKIAQDTGAGSKVPTTGKKIQPRVGAIPVRKWHGSKHQVSVVKDGFLYRSKRYRLAPAGTTWKLSATENLPMKRPGTCCEASIAALRTNDDIALAPVTPLSSHAW